MTEERKAKLIDQITKIPDYEVAWLWNLCQKELERRDEAWPKGNGYRAFQSRRVATERGGFRQWPQETPRV